MRNEGKNRADLTNVSTSFCLFKQLLLIHFLLAQRNQANSQQIHVEINCNFPLLLL